MVESGEWSYGKHVLWCTVPDAEKRKALTESGYEVFKGEKVFPGSG